MNNIPSANSLSASVRVYRTLLAAYPKTFREHYETHMVQVFRDSFREAYHYSGIPGVVDLWIHTLFDLIFTALYERIMERSRYMFSPKVTLWGGVASIFGGLFWLIAGLTLMAGDAQSGGGISIGFTLLLGWGGLAAVYSRLARQGGILGLAGFALGIIGTAVILAAQWWDETQSILIGLLGLAIIGFGLALLGLTSLREKILPRLRGLPLVMGLLYLFEAAAFWTIFYAPLSHGQNPWHPWNPPAYMPVFAGFVLIGLSWIGLGATLATEGDAQIPFTQPPSASA